MTVYYRYLGVNPKQFKSTIYAVALLQAGDIVPIEKFEEDRYANHKEWEKVSAKAANAKSKDSDVEAEAPYPEEEIKNEAQPEEPISQPEHENKEEE